MSTLRIVLCQCNLLVGDVSGNKEKILTLAHRARDELKADMAVFPELAITSYPPDDLLLRKDFLQSAEDALAELTQRLQGIDVLLGHPHRNQGKLFNAASLIQQGRLVDTYYKQYLPNYGVFDEKRYFTPGDASCVVDCKGTAIGVTICEDLWESSPIARAAEKKAKLLININASPYYRGRFNERLLFVQQQAHRHHLSILYLNLIGGQDELVFDGHSFVVAQDGVLTHRAKPFTEELVQVDIESPGRPLAGSLAPELSDLESVYQALVLGARDYVVKNGFPGAIVGISGGIDSALTLCIAVDALGPEHVLAVLMPSPYTAEMSIIDAKAEAASLGVEHLMLSIEPTVKSLRDTLAEPFQGKKTDATEENIQARVRGTLLMALSNKSRRIVLTTGNKSEMAVGYATLYGDMAGGYAVLKDVPKTLVYQLAAFRNHMGQPIPQRVFDRPPSAELAPDQRDEDSLPPYAVLDPILERYVERDQQLSEIVAAGFSEAIVNKVIAMVDRNEYKRRQAPPGVRITPRAFGRDRRYPITSGFNAGTKNKR